MTSIATVQLVISVFVPFTGVLLARRLAIALGVAVACALAGVLLTAAVTAWPPASVVAGAVLVQAIAQLVGTGAGLLIRRPVLAMAATIVVPMTATVLLSAIGLRWLTPYGNAQALLAGTFTAKTLVVALLWGVVPNVIGARRP